MKFDPKRHVKPKEKNRPRWSISYDRWAQKLILQCERCIPEAGRKVASGFFFTPHTLFHTPLNTLQMNPNIAVQEIMTRNPVTVQPNTGLGVVRELFSKNSFHHVPVAGLGGELIGIISREDFFKVAYVLSVEATKSDKAKSHFHSLVAEDIMTKYPLQLSPDDTIGLAADIFLANKFHAVPIVDDGQLVGIVTSHDLLAFSFSSPVGEEIELENFEEA